MRCSLRLETSEAVPQTTCGMSSFFLSPFFFCQPLFLRAMSSGGQGTRKTADRKKKGTEKSANQEVGPHELAENAPSSQRLTTAFRNLTHPQSAVAAEMFSPADCLSNIQNPSHGRIQRVLSRDISRPCQ